MNETEQAETPEQKKKRKQHEAWARWYASPRGAAYRLKMNERRRMAAAGVDPDKADGK